MILRGNNRRGLTLGVDAQLLEPFQEVALLVVVQDRVAPLDNRILTLLCVGDDGHTATPEPVDLGDEIALLL